MKVFFVVGEASGDVIAANLIKNLLIQQVIKVECKGIGGPLMKQAGCEILLPMEEVSAFGILEVIPKIPHILKIKDALINEIEKFNPDIVITVDFPEFNYMVAKALKSHSKWKGKIIHYVAPSVWAWREGRAKKLSQYYDGIMCLFPMEVPYFTKFGMKAVYVGHPVVENFETVPVEHSYRALNNIDSNTVILGLFFGSRETEFKMMKKVILQAARYIIETKKNVHIIVPTLPKNEFAIQNIISDLEAPCFISADPNFKWEAFQACDVAIAVSGTVGLELAYADVPHVITYKLNPITYFILRLLVKVKNAHLVNILLGKEVVPEFIQSNAEPEKIAVSVLELISKKEKRDEMKAGFSEFRKMLGGEDNILPSQRAANFVFSMLKDKKK